MTTATLDTSTTTHFAFAPPAPVANLPAPLVRPLPIISQAGKNALDDALALRRSAKQHGLELRFFGDAGAVVGALGVAGGGVMEASALAAGTNPVWFGVIMAVGVASALGGRYLWKRAGAKHREAEQAVKDSVDALAKSFPVPAANASLEERVANAWLARSVFGDVMGTLSPSETSDYLESINAVAKGIDEQHAGRIRGLTNAFFDSYGQPTKRLWNIDILGEQLRRLPDDVRARLLKVVEGPLKTAVRGDPNAPSPWRAQAFEDALAGNVFRYATLVKGQAASELSPLHPERIRFEQIAESLDEQLRARAKEGESTLYAKATLPPELGEQQAFRLAARYEEMGGYRVYLHPEGRNILITVCTENDIPVASSIEEKGGSVRTVHLDA